jgi:hypothetical protein
MLPVRLAAGSKSRSAADGAELDGGLDDAAVSGAGVRGGRGGPGLLVLTPGRAGRGRRGDGRDEE